MLHSTIQVKTLVKKTHTILGDFILLDAKVGMGAEQ